MTKERAHLLITGRVQGVYFRSYARSEAENLNLKGWVRNSVGGSVEIIVEGNKADIKKFIDWCHEGSPPSKVTRVQVEWQEYQGEFDRFSISY